MATTKPNGNIVHPTSKPQPVQGTKTAGLPRPDSMRKKGGK